MRRRLTWAITLVAVASVTLFALPLAAFVGRTYRDEELLRLERDTIAATRRIDVTPGGADPVELPQSGDRLAVYGVDGRRIIGAGPLTADAVTARALRADRPVDAEVRGRFVAAVPLVAREQVQGVLRASRTTAAVNRRVHRAWLALAGLAIVVVLLAVGAAVAVARRFSRPLESLAGAASRLGDGDFGARVPVSGVTEVDAVAEAMHVTGERLDELITRERAFSADASHQLRTPLAALRIELEAMELEQPGTDGLTRALVQVDRLQQTIETLLAVARDDPRDGGAADLREAIEQVRAVWEPLLAANGRALLMSVDASDPVAAASPRVVREILSVLLTNAAEHGAGTVTITVRDLAGWYAVDVADEGPGVEAPDTLFDRRRASADGHGIGLALARSLADAERGRLLLSREAPAPVFTLMLPAATL